MVHKDKLWIKFDELDIECFCNYEHRRCTPEDREGCHLYLAKFIQLKTEEAEAKITEATKKSQSHIEKLLRQEQKKFESEVKRSIRKFRI